VLVRARIEKIFGTWKRSYRFRAMRGTGLAKARLQVHLAAVAYNVKGLYGCKWRERICTATQAKSQNFRAQSQGPTLSYPSAGDLRAAATQKPAPDLSPSNSENEDISATSLVVRETFFSD
jgi:hypothetical protein